MNRAGSTILSPLGYESYNDRKKVPQKVKMWNQIQMLMKSRTAIGVENDENGAMYEKHC